MLSLPWPLPIHSKDLEAQATKQGSDASIEPAGLHHARMEAGSLAGGCTSQKVLQQCGNRPSGLRAGVEAGHLSEQERSAQDGHSSR